MVDAIAFVNVNCQSYCKIMDATHLLNLFRLLDTYVKELKPNDFGVIEQWQIDTFRHY